MKPRILIAGSGRMALDIGLFFLQREYPVVFVSRSQDRLEEIASRVEKTRKRLERFIPEKNIRIQADCFQLCASAIPTADILIETTTESLQVKQEVIHSLSPCLEERTLLLSNSSSILPHEIHPRCLGVHWFYPVEMSRMVELVTTGTEQTLMQDKVQRLLRDNSFAVLKQEELSAFVVNRLLVPLQAFCLSALQQGWPAEDVDNASRAGCLPLGQLSFMDAIGLDVIFAAVTNYQHRFRPLAEADTGIMLSGLQQLLHTGKLGIKNRNGLLMGDSLPWPVSAKTSSERDQLARECADYLEASCREALRQDLLTAAQLQMVFAEIFHTNGLPDISSLC